MPELESIIEQKLIEQLVYGDVQTRFKDRSGFMEQF